MIDDYPSLADGSKDQTQIRSMKAKQDQFNACLAQVVGKYEKLNDEIKVRL